MADMYCLHKLESLKNRQAFKLVYSRGKYSASSMFVVYALANETDRHRYGLSVSKKVGNAVVRNRVRRWLKEYIRLNASEFIMDKGYDFVVVARVPVGKLPRDGAFQKIGQEVQHRLRKLGLVK